MKTKAFALRVTICLLLSLIPLTELENRLYTIRMKARGHWKNEAQVVIVKVPSADLNDAGRLTMLTHQILDQNPLQIWIDPSHPLITGKLGFQTQACLENPWITDADGMVRRALLFSKGQPSLTYLAYLHKSLKPPRLPDLQESHFINYMGPKEIIPSCHLSTGQGERTCNLNGRIIILAQEETEQRFHTPWGDMSHAEILANDIHTVVFHHPIRLTSFLFRILLTLSMIVLGAFFIIFYPVLISSLAITGTGIFVIIIFFQILFQTFNIYIPSVNLGCSLLLTYLVFTGYRLALQENLQWRSLKQAQYLRELDQMKANFLSLVSHDLKTPIAKIQAMVERLRREVLLPPEERVDWKDAIDSIENSNNEMKRFITSILSLSKLESQKVILNIKSNDINFLIQQALKRMFPLAQQKNIQFEEFLDPLFSIECDEDLMRQVLTNLIDNAIKYSPLHSKVVVRSREEDGFVRVEVEDFGPGIPKDQLPLMFRKFSRFLRPIKEEVKGSGLGLYLSKYFIELHGGTIRVKSTEGIGTTFGFTLPLRGNKKQTLSD